MRYVTRFASSVVVHAVAALLLVRLWDPSQVEDPQLPRTETLVWTSGSGGEKGGSMASRAVRSTQPTREPTPQRFKVPSIPAPLALLELPGLVAVVAASDSDGTGTSDKAGRGGKGDGPGAGDEKGPGPGSGDGPLLPGTPGLIQPDVIVEKKPVYTSAALAAKLQGSVLLEAIVLADGSVGSVRILRSLDDRFGLDQKAIEAVRLWKFRPGTRFGKPVVVPVLIELIFTLR